MSLTTDLIDQIAKKHDLKNDCQIANHLKIKPATVYRYRDGYTMDFKIAKKVCRDLGLDEGITFAKLAADREVSTEMKQTWKEIAKRLSATAAAIFLVILYPVGEALQHCILC